MRFDLALQWDLLINHFCVVTPHADSDPHIYVRVYIYVHINRKEKEIEEQGGHHARPRRASATAPLRTGADTCKTGSGSGKRSGAKSEPVRRRSNHEWMEGRQAGKSVPT